MTTPDGKPSFVPALLSMLILRDPPLCEVTHIDRPTERPRLIRMQAQDACRWAHVTSYGETDITKAPHAIQANQGWMCGPWLARLNIHPLDTMNKKNVKEKG